MISAAVVAFGLLYLPLVMNFGVLVCMQAAEATASEKVVAIAAAAEKLEAESTDLADVSRVRQSDDVAAAEKAVEGEGAFGLPSILGFFFLACFYAWKNVSSRFLMASALFFCFFIGISL